MYGAERSERAGRPASLIINLLMNAVSGGGGVAGNQATCCTGGSRERERERELTVAGEWERERDERQGKGRSTC